MSARPTPGGAGTPDLQLELTSPDSAVVGKAVRKITKDL